MRIGGRSLGRGIAAISAGEHYAALANAFRVYQSPLSAMSRYLFRTGGYPATVAVRTPIGPLDLRLFCADDMLTVNEVFCRHDYPADARDPVCVDFGSNIGISAAWFLSRSRRCHAYLFEPFPPNVAHLKENLVRFEGRYSLQPVAVGLFNGEVEFGFEPTGRYGGIGLTHHGQTMRVPCVDSNGVLEDVLSRHGEIDILKIDIEALEQEVVERIPAPVSRRIRKIYVEGRFSSNPLAASHSLGRRGSIAAFVRTS